MLFRVLGPLEVRAGDRWAGIGAPKWRAVLAALLAEPGQVVSADRLADELWGDNPPPGARKQVSGYVLRLRRLIGDPDGRVIATRPPGYKASVPPADVDAGVFEDLLAAGREALKTQEAVRARSVLGEALALWRGPALADVPLGALSAAAANNWEELRLTAVELRIEADLACGCAAEIVAELHRLTAAHPLRERLWLLLMRALKDSGRSAEALEVYARARRLVADELGADLDPALRQLHRQLLVAAPDTPAVPLPAAVDAAPATPRQLPAAPAHFTGRSDELERLTRLLDHGADPVGTVVVAAIGGIAGIGKSALALRWAHHVAARFPDGQLYVNLRGPGADSPPVPPDEATRVFLHALGVAPERVPADPGARAGLFRSLTAGKRMLIVLDDARDTAQVRPLLPGGPGCMVLVTSRDQLASLVAGEGAYPVTLGPLDQAEALKLLARRLGMWRTAREPGAVCDIIRLCDGHPLALAAAAARAALSPQVPLTALAAELEDTARRLGKQ